MNYLIYRTLAVASIVLVGSGCSDTLPPLDEAQGATVAAAKIAAHPLSEQQHGKQSLPVKLDYAFLNEPVVGQPLTIRLNITTSSVSQLDMRMNTRGSLALSKNTPQSVPLKTGSSGQPEAYEAVVVASEEGRSYLNVQITGIFENQPFTKAVSIPVQVGAGGPVLEKNGEIIDTGVEVLSSMPARQTVTLKESENP